MPQESIRYVFRGSLLIYRSQDSIRDVEMNKFKRMECLSGGYCGKIFVTDITRFKADNLTQNGKYDAGNAISSVSWNPGLSTPTHCSTLIHTLTCTNYIFCLKKNVHKV